MFDQGLARAKELDAYFAKTGKTVGPLHGLPISLKVSDLDFHDAYRPRTDSVICAGPIQPHRSRLDDRIRVVREQALEGRLDARHSPRTSRRRLLLQDQRTCHVDAGREYQQYLGQDRQLA